MLSNKKLEKNVQMSLKCILHSTYFQRNEVTCVLIMVSIKCSCTKVLHFYDIRHTCFTIGANVSSRTFAYITVHSVITFPAIRARVTVAVIVVWN